MNDYVCILSPLMVITIVHLLFCSLNSFLTPFICTCANNVRSSMCSCLLFLKVLRANLERVWDA